MKTFFATNFGSNLFLWPSSPMPYFLQIHPQHTPSPVTLLSSLAAHVRVVLLCSLWGASQRIRNCQWDDPYGGSNKGGCGYSCAIGCAIPIVKTECYPNRPPQPSIRHHICRGNHGWNHDIFPALQMVAKNEDNASRHHRGHCMNSRKPERKTTDRNWLVAVIDVNPPIQRRIL